MKTILQSKTIWLAIFTAFGGIITAISATDPAVANMGWFLVIKACVDAILRINTTKAIM